MRDINNFSDRLADTVHRSMNWKLTVVWYRHGECKVYYKDVLWDLPEDKDKVLRDLSRILPRDVAEVVYEKIIQEVGKVLEEMGVHPWTRLEPESPLTVPEPIRITPQYRQYEWVAGATPVQDRMTNVHYVTAEEYERMRNAGELERDTMYLVLN